MMPSLPGSPLRRAGFRASVVLCLIPSLAYAQNLVSEYAVKAAYLFDFGKFVRYAPAPDAQQRQTFDICVVGENPFGHLLDQLVANERLDGKPVRVLHLKSAGEARECSIAYISASEGPHIREDLEQLRGRPVLTVSDAATFLRDGGIIQFVTAGSHVRFEVNLEAARSAQINLSSELLRVALSVQGNRATEVRP